MRLLTVFACVCALAAAGCASGGVQPRKGMSLQEVRGLCITHQPGGADNYGPSCGGAAHHDICDTYMDPLPGMTSRAECMEHCEQAWKTLVHRYTGKDCGPQVPRGKELCRQYCLTLP